MTLEFDVKLIRILFEISAAAFILAVLIAPKFIPFLTRLKFGQEVRDLGPESHLKKQGTPTMGGIMILGAMLAACLIGFAAVRSFDMASLQVLFLTVMFGVIGFADDYLKIRRHNSEGLSAKGKLIFQLLVSVVFTLWIWFCPQEGIAAGKVYVPFNGYGESALSFAMPLWLFLPFSVFVILGTDNGVNFTDGLDGLCSGVTVIVAVFFSVCGLLMSRGVALVSAAVAGALAGFLLFNAYPAKVFMGDTGSLALGGFVAGCAMITGSELYILIFGLVYLVEVISVMIQVAYFKATHGKRFFKMAPIHHHFELCGNSETRIVTAFVIITAFLAGLAGIGFFYIR